MHKPSQVVKGTMILTAGRITGFALSFLRNLLLARLLSKADYGLAASFSMILTLLEINARFSFGHQIIQSTLGAQPDFQATAQLMQFIGGMVSAVMVVGMAAPMAYLFGVPHTWWAFALLGLVPLCAGVGHLDISRFQRDLNYAPLVLIDVVPQFLVTIAVWPLAVWLKDYRVLVCVMIGKSLLAVAMSFAFARLPYRWAWRPAYIKSMLKFGWPLLLNGLVMFGSYQADRIIVGVALSLNEVAGYALAFSLVNLPWFIFGQVGSSLMLPLMSQAQNDPARLRFQYRLCSHTAAALGTLSLIPLMLVGEEFIVLFYGAKYAGTGPIVAMLGAASIVRFLRLAPSIASLARGDTMNELCTNLWRCISLPLALLLAAGGGTVALIASANLVGELIAVSASVFLLAKRQKVPWRDSARSGAFVLSLVGLGTAISWHHQQGYHLTDAIAVVLLSFLLILGLVRLTFHEAYDLIMATLRRQCGFTVKTAA